MKRSKTVFVMLLCLLLGIGTGIFPEARAAEPMTASEAGVEWIKTLEGFSKYPYYDYSQYTVGYGTRCPADKFEEYKANGISREDAEALLRQHIEKVESELNQRILQKYDLTLTQNEFDALVSLSFNVGTGWVWGSQENCLKSVILSRAGENAIVYAFSLYSNAGGKVSPGLVVRRLCEANLFLNGVYEKRVNPDYGYVLYDPGEGSVPYSVQGFTAGTPSVPAADARRKGAAFLGWYPAPAGGTRVTQLTGELNGKTLYAHWQLEEPETMPEATEGVAVKVTGDVVNLRKGPGTNYERIGKVSRNEMLTVTSVAEGTLLQWGETEKGWICLDYTDYRKTGEALPEPEPPEETVPQTQPETQPAETQPEETSPPQTEDHIQTRLSGTVQAVGGLRVRKGPGTEYALAGSLWNGDRVEVTQVQTVGTVRWGKTELGWISMDYVIPDTTVPEETSPEETETRPEETSSSVCRGRVNADLLRIRSGPGTNYRILGFYPDGEEVEILEQVQNLGAAWGKTNLGWVSMAYIDIF